MDVPNPVVVAVGGVAGAGCRWGLFEAIDDPATALVVVNTVGALIVGALVHRVRHPFARSRLLLGVGFCGALTTFSTLTLDTAVRFDEGRVGDAIGLVAISLTFGVVAVLIGALVGQRSP